MNRKRLPFDLICDPEFLMIAWKQVRANRGAAGVDLVTIAQFERNLAKNLIELAARLREGRYYPMPARTFEMKKASGGVRTLAILTVEDRIVQRATLNAIEPLFEPAFLDCSFGFRPARNVQMAVERVLEHRAAGDIYIVDADIADCFGSLDHDLVMGLVGARVRDKRLLALIRMWLDCGQLLANGDEAIHPGHPGESKNIIERVSDYATRSVNSAVTHLLDDDTGYGRYPAYPTGPFYGAGIHQNLGPDIGRDPTLINEADEAAAAELQKHARKEAMKRLGRDGAVLLLTSALKARRFVNPATMAVAGAAVLAVAAYPSASRYVRDRLSRKTSGVGAIQSGVLQGGSLSPLLANVVLHEFDLKMARAGFHLVRYADDFVITTRDERSAHAALELAARELHKLKLQLHPQKTRVTRFDQGLDFLGYRFHPHLIAAAPAPEDDRLPLREWWRQSTEVIKKVPAQIAPAAADFSRRAKERISDHATAAIARVKAFVGRKQEAAR
jgi:RNA-directed DNA polymerase